MSRALTIVIAVLVLLGALAVFGFINDPFGWRKHQVAALQTKVVEKTAEAAVATGQAAANSDGAKIIERSTIRTETTRIIHEENADAIRKAPGADAPLDPGLLATINRGLCRYSSAGDPGCAPMRPAGAQDIPH